MAKRNSARKQASGTEAEIVLPAVPAEPGELIDGSEDDTTALERGIPAPDASSVGSEKKKSSPAAAAASRAVLKATATQRVKETMSETSKAEMIRSEIAARKSAGEDTIRPRDIVAALAAKNIKVHAPQVSVALRDFGKPAPAAAKADKPAKPARETKRVLARVKPASSAKPAPKAAIGAGPSYAEMTTVGAFVNSLGGLDKARAMLDAYARLLNPTA